MSWPHVLYFATILIALAIMGFLAVYSWRHRRTVGATTVMWIALSGCYQALAEVLFMISQTPERALFWFDTRFLSLAVVPVLWLIFVLEYTGRKNWLSKRLLAGMFVIPVITQVMIWSNSLHGLWLQHNVDFHQSGPFLMANISARIPGPWFMVHSIYGYILLLTGVVLVLIMAWRQARLYRGQAVLLASGASIMVLASLIPTLNLNPGAEFNPLTQSMALGTLLIAAAVFRFRFLDMAPIARDLIIDSMDDSMIVLDTFNRIVDINSGMRALLSEAFRLEGRFLPANLVGQPAREILYPLRELAQYFQADSIVQEEITVAVSELERYYGLRIFPLVDWKGELSGRVGFLRNITERTRTEKALRESERQWRNAFGTEALRERAKELNCLYGISALAERPGISLAEILQGAVELIPPAWQYPEIAGARIVLEDQEFKTANFQETAWMQSRDIVTRGEPVGRAEVCYLVERPTSGEGPFMVEERRLLNAIAEQLSRVFEKIQAEEALRLNEERMRVALQGSPIVVFNQDKELRYTWIYNPNPGFTIEQALGKTDADLLPAEDAANLIAIKRQVLESGVGARTEVRTTIDGVAFFYDLNVEPLHDAVGNIIGVTCSSIDITARKRAEEALKKSTQLLRDAGEMAKVGGWELDLSTQEVSWTEAVGRIHGVEPGYRPKLEEALNFYAPESRPAVEVVLKKAAETGEPYDLESLFIPSGSKEKIWVRSLGRAVYSGGKIVKLAGTFQNIDKYKRAEEALQESEQRYRSLFTDAQRQAQELALLDQVRTALARELDLPAVFRTVVEAIANTFGYTQVSLYLLQGDVLVLQHQVGYDHVIAQIPITQGTSGRVARTGEPVLLEDVRADPTFLGAIEGIVSDVCVPLFDQGRVVGTLNVESTDGVKLTEADLRLMTALSEHVSIAIKNARLYDAAQRELAERKQAEETLQKAKEFSESLIASMQDGFSVLDSHSVHIDANPALCQITGFSREELIGAGPPHPYWPPEAYEEVNKAFQKTLRGEFGDVELTFMRKNGERFPVIVSPSWIKDKQGNVIIYFATVKDITERKRAEEMLRESEERYRSLFNGVPVGLYRTTPYGQIMDANPALVQILGYPNRESLLAVKVADGYVDSKERTRWQALMERAGGIRDFVTQWRRYDGTIIWVRDNAQSVCAADGRVLYYEGTAEDITARKQAEEALRESEEKHRTLFETMARGVVYQTASGEITSANPAAERILGLTLDQMQGRTSVDPRWKAMHEDGSEFLGETHPSMVALHTGKEVRNVVMGVFSPQTDEYRWINIHAVPSFRPGEDAPYQVYTTFEDITARKQAEEQLRASLREKEVLLQEIHHRVKNNLQVVSSLLSLQAEQTKDRQTFEAFRGSQNRIRSMALIHEKLYQSPDLARVDFAEYLQSLAAALCRSYGADVRGISLSIQTDKILLGIDTATPCGLLLNELISNALKHAFPAGRAGEIRIEFRVNGDKQCILRVSDNGVGFPQDLEFRTMESLGLQLVNTLVRQLAGSIKLERAGGTSFEITFTAS